MQWLCQALWCQQEKVSFPPFLQFAPCLLPSWFGGLLNGRNCNPPKRRNASHLYKKANALKPNPLFHSYIYISINTLAMRSIWKGSIGFGLVNIPIKLYSAVQSSSLDLDMLDSRDHARIRYQRVNEHTHKEVPYDKIVKGYKLNDDYVILEDRDFEDARS